MRQISILAAALLLATYIYKEGEMCTLAPGGGLWTATKQLGTEHFSQLGHTIYRKSKTPHKDYQSKTLVPKQKDGGR